MEVILKEDIEKIGKAGELANVKSGYARNYLLPQGLAIASTKSAAKVIEEHMKQRTKRIAAEKSDAEKMADALSSLKLTYTRRAGEEGKLFGSVTAHEIGADIIKKGFAIDKRKVLLDMPLKELGEHKVSVKVHPEVTAQITVEVKAEEVETLPESEIVEPTEKTPEESSQEK